MSDTASNNRTAKLGLGEKIGYGLGDFGFNFYWAIIGSWLMFFYTDIFGISAAAAGTIFLVTRFIDACTDPIIGGIADRTNSRWGKFRPYLLFGAIPMAAAAILTMTTPDFSEQGKAIWVFFTYSGMMLCYTLLNMPYNSLAGVLTANTQERNNIFGIRFVFAYTAGIIVGTVTPKLALALGGADEKLGWQLTMVVYSVIATILFWVCFATTKERIQPPAQQKSNPLTDLGDLIKSRAWVVLVVIFLIIMVTITLRSQSAPYFLKYFALRPDLMGAYVGLQFAAYAVGCAMTPYLANRFDKVRLLFTLMSIVAALSFLFMFVPKPSAVGVVTIQATEETSVQTLHAAELLGEDSSSTDMFTWKEHKPDFWIFTQRLDAGNGASFEVTLEPGQKRIFSVVKESTLADGSKSVADSATLPKEIIIIFLLNILISLALGPKSPLTWSMCADVADYNEWKTGRRATAMTFAATTFSQKMGSALASFLMGIVLLSIGYVANQAQDGASTDGILYLQTLFPAIFAIISVIALKFYDLDHNKLEEIQAELNKKDDAEQS